MEASGTVASCATGFVFLPWGLRIPITCLYYMFIIHFIIYVSYMLYDIIPMICRRTGPVFLIVSSLGTPALEARANDTYYYLF